MLRSVVLLVLLVCASSAQAAQIPLHTERTFPFHQKVEFFINGQTYTTRSDAPFSFSADGYVDTDAQTFTLTGFSATLPTGSLYAESNTFELGVYRLGFDWEPSSEFGPRPTTQSGQVLPDPYTVPLQPGEMWFGAVGIIRVSGGPQQNQQFLGSGVMRAALQIDCAPLCSMELATWIYGGGNATPKGIQAFDFLPGGTVVTAWVTPYDDPPQAPEPTGLFAGPLLGMMWLSLRRARWSDRRSPAARR